MGKAAMCIQMLQILNSGRIYKVSELADLLDTNPRNIIEYKRELEEAGYYIISIPGKLGGYRLDRTDIIPSLKFSEEEKKALSEGAGYLEARKDFLFKKDYKLAMSKVYSSIKHGEPQTEPLVINRFPLVMQDQELHARYNAIEKCILRSLKLKITYTSLDNSVTQRIVHPYRLYMYNNSWYFIGFDENSGGIRYFKLNRINKFEILTQQKFRKLLSYIESDYFDEFGMKQNGEWFDIKLKLTGTYAMLAKERVYGKDQIVEEVDDKTTILTCKMQNEELILQFVLGFGANCEVLEPQWLKEKVKNTVINISTKY